MAADGIEEQQLAAGEKIEVAADAAPQELDGLVAGLDAKRFGGEGQRRPARLGRRLSLPVAPVGRAVEQAVGAAVAGNDKRLIARMKGTVIVVGVGLAAIVAHPLPFGDQPRGRGHAVVAAAVNQFGAAWANA